eukprot:g1225.t1
MAIKRRISTALNRPLFTKELPFRKQDMAAFIFTLRKAMLKWRRATALLARRYLRFKRLTFRELSKHRIIERCKGRSALQQWQAVISISYRDKLRAILAKLKGGDKAANGVRDCLFNAVKRGCNTVELPGLLLGESPRRTELIGLLADFIYINNEEQLSKRIFGKIPLTPAIVHVDLSANKLGVQGGRVVSRILETNDVIKSVNLAQNNLVGDPSTLTPDFSAVAALAKAIRHNRTMTMINLSRNQLGGWSHQLRQECIGELAGAFRENESLSALDLSKSRLNADDLQLLFQFDAPSQTATQPLEHELKQKHRHRRMRASKQQELVMNLNLQANPNLVGPLADPLAGIRALCTAVGRGCKGLLELNLSSNCLKQRSCTLLAEALERNETLSSLDLSDNEMIGDQGVLALARSVW